MTHRIDTHTSSLTVRRRTIVGGYVFGPRVCLSVYRVTQKDLVDFAETLLFGRYCSGVPESIMCDRGVTLHQRIPNFTQ